MSYARHHSDRRWSIVLAGGEGERVRPLVERWLGCHKPKQYCTFVGRRSMFQHTLDRITTLTDPEHTVTIVAREHRHEVWRQLDGRKTGVVLFQPQNRNTAAGILLPLTHIRASDPQATVTIFPSDHFVHPESTFLEAVQRAIWTVEWMPDRLVLMGARPEGLELEYGWIQPGSTLAYAHGYRVRTVQEFLEKPDAARARKAMASGAIWNTLVLAAKVDTLWKLAWRRLPDLMPYFERISQVLGTAEEGPTVEAAYQRLPMRNFSSHFLEFVPHEISTIELSGTTWSDWGNPHRIAATLERVGKAPHFPLDCVQPANTYAIPQPKAAGIGPTV